MVHSSNQGAESGDRRSRLPPEAWPVAQRLRVGVMAPIERFLHVEAASGILLLLSAVAALAWANSPWRESYQHVWHAHLAITTPLFTFDQSLHFWVNDVLMTIFFFVVGLEIRREIADGELSELKRASLPIAAAVGGMVVPAGIYLAFNASNEARGGWGVPMATDIAFAVGILSLLGKRVPAALRILLLALAIIDDIGAILVIAVFYSSQFDVTGLYWVAGGLTGVVVMQRSGFRLAAGYIPVGAALWYGTWKVGVHPTIAGVALGLMTPSRSWFGKEGFSRAVRGALSDLEANRDSTDEHELLEPLDRIAVARREALSPVVRLQTLLHPWVAYFIMPVFALANAGVTVAGLDFSAPTAVPVTAGVVVGLVIGKPLGVVGASYLACRLGVAALPRGVGFGGVLVVGAAAGIGFTMAIFIAELAFVGSQSLAISKLAVLVASAVAGVGSLVLGALVLPKVLPHDVSSVSAAQAEASTDL